MQFFEKIPSVHIYSNKSNKPAPRIVFFQIQVTFQWAIGSIGLRHVSDTRPTPVWGVEKEIVFTKKFTKWIAYDYERL